MVQGQCAEKYNESKKQINDYNLVLIIGNNFGHNCLDFYDLLVYCYDECVNAYKISLT